MAFGDLQSYSLGKKEPKSTLFEEEANGLDGIPESGNVPDIGMGPDCAVTEKMEGRAQRRTCLCNRRGHGQLDRPGSVREKADGFRVNGNKEEGRLTNKLRLAPVFSPLWVICWRDEGREAAIVGGDGNNGSGASILIVDGECRESREESSRSRCSAAASCARSWSISERSSAGGCGGRDCTCECNAVDAVELPPEVIANRRAFSCSSSATRLYGNKRVGQRATSRKKEREHTLPWSRTPRAFFV